MIAKKAPITRISTNVPSTVSVVITRSGSSLKTVMPGCRTTVATALPVVNPRWSWVGSVIARATVSCNVSPRALITRPLSPHTVTVVSPADRCDREIVRGESKCTSTAVDGLSVGGAGRSAIHAVRTNGVKRNTDLDRGHIIRAILSAVADHALLQEVSARVYAQ